ncbi:type II toxin-antitoxin system VapC family toxin [Haemophilus haemoglobinophilus]|nr:type II toxin-antitoxin system VapC family toxin [Canicola haemoglobinophilus]MBN6712310.1 type II toxin-antitoxin system VapC family toxin [Canicola haemoglobinophilus]
MKLLLDTHILLWLAWNKKEKLSPQAIDLLENLENELYISMASLWEISIKSSLGKPDFSIDVEKLIEGATRIGCKVLLIEITHILKLNQLVTVHKDPFDRLLLAQAESEKIYFLTADQLILKHSSSYLLNASG